MVRGMGGEGTVEVERVQHLMQRLVKRHDMVGLILCCMESVEKHHPCRGRFSRVLIDDMENIFESHHCSRRRQLGPCDIQLGEIAPPSSGLRSLPLPWPLHSQEWSSTWWHCRRRRGGCPCGRTSWVSRSASRRNWACMRNKQTTPWWQKLNQHSMRAGQ